MRVLAQFSIWRSYGIWFWWSTNAAGRYLCTICAVRRKNCRMGKGCIQVIKLYADEHRFTFVFVFIQNASKPTNNVRKMVRGFKRSKAPIRATIVSIILFTNLYYNNYIDMLLIFFCFSVSAREILPWKKISLSTDILTPSKRSW